MRHDIDRKSPLQASSMHLLPIGPSPVLPYSCQGRIGVNNCERDIVEVFSVCRLSKEEEKSELPNKFRSKRGAGGWARGRDETASPSPSDPPFNQHQSPQEDAK